MPGLSLIPGVGSAPELSKFRGNWVDTPEVLAYVENIAVENASRWTVSGTTMARVEIAAAVGSNKPAGILHAQQFGWPDGALPNRGTEMRYYIEDIPELRGKSLTRVEVVHGYRVKVARAWVGVDGAPGITSGESTSSVTTTGWKTTELIPPTSYLKFGINTGSSFTTDENGQLAVGRINFYAVDSTFPPYMKDQYVTHLGRLWLSEVDDNTFVPGGVEGGWTAVPIVDTNAARATDLTALAERVTSTEGEVAERATSADLTALTERVGAVEARLPVYVAGAIPADAVAPYLVVDTTTDPITLAFVAGA